MEEKKKETAKEIFKKGRKDFWWKAYVKRKQGRRVPEWLTAMSEETFRQALDFIAEGISPHGVAKLLIDTGDLQFKDKDAFALWFYRFIHKNKIKYVHSQIPRSMQKLRRSVDDQDRIDVIDAFQIILNLQMERIIINFEKEITDKQTNEETDKQIRTMNLVLKTLSDVEIGRANSNRRIQPVQVSSLPTSEELVDKMKTDYERKYGVKTVQILSDPAARRRLLNVIEHVRNGSTGELAHILDRNAQKIREFELQKQDYHQKSGNDDCIDTEEIKNDNS